MFGSLISDFRIVGEDSIDVVCVIVNLAFFKIFIWWPGFDMFILSRISCVRSVKSSSVNSAVLSSLAYLVISSADNGRSDNQSVQSFIARSAMFSYLVDDPMSS